MSEDAWTAVDQYLSDALIPSHRILSDTLEANQSGGLPAHDVSAPQGKFLSLLARFNQAKRILEIGTLGGYSTVWLARALPSGDPSGDTTTSKRNKNSKIITLEIDPDRARIAAANIARAGLTHAVDIRVGPALRTLEAMASEVRADGKFDFVFIDADKWNNRAYFEWALKFSRVGALIVVDNVVRDGKVVDPLSADPSVRGVRNLVQLLEAERCVEATALQTVGSKGWDGFIMALVVEEVDGDVEVGI